MLDLNTGFDLAGAVADLSNVDNIFNVMDELGYLVGRNYVLGAELYYRFGAAKPQIDVVLQEAAKAVKLAETPGQARIVFKAVLDAAGGAGKYKDHGARFLDLCMELLNELRTQHAPVRPLAKAVLDFQNALQTGRAALDLAPIVGPVVGIGVGAVALTKAASLLKRDGHSAMGAQTSFREVLSAANKVVKAASSYANGHLHHPLTPASVLASWRGSVKMAARTLVELTDTLKKAETDPSYGNKWIDTANALVAQLKDISFTKEIEALFQDYVALLEGLGRDTVAFFRHAEEDIEKAAKIPWYAWAAAGTVGVALIVAVLK